jgi:2-polyprenyl-3-methyl-5-hydroxy-6-metoxy-1,4-benzoquinol methylase
MSDTIVAPAPSDTTVAADPITERVRATWTAGDFGRIAAGYAPSAGEFVARLHIREGERVLDVACGTGNLALPAARAGAVTTGVDIAPNLVAQAMMNAAAEGLPATFEVGDAEALPYDDESFDTVLSMFGAMFAARPERAASELLRVVRRGGRIAMANWTPKGFIGQMLRTVAAYVPPPAGASPVLQWGDEDVVTQRLAGVESISCVRRRITFEFPCSPADTVGLFRDWYGPTVRAFAALDGPRAEALERELVTLWTDHNHAGRAATRVESEYLEVIAAR